MVWLQRRISVGPFRRGFHLLTSEITEAIPEIAQLHVGIGQVFIQHTSASLTINENADPDVRVDLETAINVIAPENLPYVHTLEGPDDMPAHIKCSLLGSHLSIPIQSGRFALGTWQGIYLCEHRDAATSRNILVTIHGE